MLIPKLSNQIAYGGDYNPEQWPEPVWHEDIALMRKAGVNLVTLGVFSWSKLEPAEHRYEFTWLDRVMDLLAENKIYVDLATATASPPPWLSARYPDVLAVDANGTAYHPGSRQHYSPCSPSYRKAAAALVRRLAQRYRRHPALALWHINNEYGNHVAECHGPHTTVAFRKWLRRRYRTLDALNSAWGTAFWSQQYSDWEEILTPRRTPTFANPTQQLDYKRFFSDAVLDLYRMELEIVRRATPDIPVTTNFMGFHKPMNYQRWAPEMDFVSWDNYPDPCIGGGAAGAAMHDLMRSLKRERPFLLMEQSVSSVTWRTVNAAKPPGLMRLWSWQALARGADGILFFQWRAAKAGAEKFLGGMVPHVPAEKSRIYDEVRALGAELKCLAPVVGTLVRPQVAIAFDWESWWALELDSKPAPIPCAAWAQEIHRYFYELNIAVDFVHPGADLARYRLVVAPALYLLRATDAENITRYIAAGGHFLATYFTGIVDENEQVVLGGYPALLRAALGIWVEEWFPLPPGEHRSIRTGSKRQSGTCTDWCDSIHAEKARVLARYSDGPLRGQAALTSHAHGKGVATYLGTKPDVTTMSRLLHALATEAGVTPPLNTPRGIETMVREGDRQRFLFLLNHSDRKLRMQLGEWAGRDLLSGRRLAGQVAIPSMGVIVIAQPKLRKDT